MPAFTSWLSGGESGFKAKFLWLPFTAPPCLLQGFFDSMLEAAGNRPGKDSFLSPCIHAPRGLQICRESQPWLKGLGSLAWLTVLCNQRCGRAPLAGGQTSLAPHPTRDAGRLTAAIWQAEALRANCKPLLWANHWCVQHQSGPMKLWWLY